MPVIQWPKAPLPNKVEGERAPQLVDHGGARMRATTWGDRWRDFTSMFAGGDPASDAMGMAGPMQVPGALGIGIVKTLGRDAPISKMGEWGRGPASEALEYLTKKFPRLSQQVEFLMDGTLGPETSARWSPINYLPYRANLVAEGGERGTGKVGSIKLNPLIHQQGLGTGTSVDSIAHEMQHAADNLRVPQVYDDAYDLVNVSPFGYSMNPYENLANITGGVERAKYLKGIGKLPEDELYNLSLQMRGRFPESMKDVLSPFLKGTNEDPFQVLQSVRSVNRALARTAEGSVMGKGGMKLDYAQQTEQLNKHLKSPDALRNAILATKKGR